MPWQGVCPMELRMKLVNALLADDDSMTALCDLWQREDTSVGIEMFVDAAVDLLEAFRALASGILDVQTEVETLAAEIGDDEKGREA